MKLLFIALFFGLFSSLYSQDSNDSDNSILCTEEFCKGFLEKEVCRKIPPACEIQNATHNGIFLPSPTPCNCCKYCLENQHESDTCFVGDPSSPTPSAICGAGLYCRVSTCQPMDISSTDSPCGRALWLYEQQKIIGTLGHLQSKPICDRNGLYESHICVPGETCFCVSEKGERIFGEIPFTSLSEISLNCKCSRNSYQGKDIRNRHLHQTEFLRCEPNGDYDALQCLDDLCLCVNPADGRPTHPEMEFVNVTQISAATLPCFNNKTHIEGEYYRDCEYSYHQELKNIRKYEKEGFEGLVYLLPNCQQDGHYAPVQQTSKGKYCADPFGKRLENFEVSKTDPLYSSMDCKCARTRNIMIGEEKPECCRNGNYNRIQCRRGLCRCVDQDGVQVQKEVEYYKRHELRCFNNQCI
ncbi:hypothetical protein ILUMI_20778 [Ignelater luminosus]|uniref:Thyroglobulin type-1 domain-containing protein n=1 Tax=Ignelater luminosus TaxID=2038154 RepID=A0A8K0CDF8_IGNLU|nr:hypothetical protein ILUMI_20778 [Ignelater luminosus]